MTPHLARASLTAALSVTSILTLSLTASALEGGVRLEPGVAVPLAAPQIDRFQVGGTLSLKGYLAFSRYFEAQAGVTFVGLGDGIDATPSTLGTAWSDSVGLRLKRPHDLNVGESRFWAGSPWIDGDAHYLRTGPLERFAATAGVGVSFPLDEDRHAWLGPFVRYMQIVERSRAGFDSTDARILFIGLNFELGTSPLPVPPPVFAPPPPAPCPTCAPVVPCPYCAPIVEPVVPVPLPDRDGDGVSDAMDNCPDVKGPAENGGCPVYKKIIVRADRLELREKIFFAFDRSNIKPESFALLDDVVLALSDNKGFRVAIEGHTDTTGPKAHNQELSEQRAESVHKYLTDHGIAGDRLTHQGYGETVPLESNNTVAGREKNRRVEFVVKSKNLDGSEK